MEMEYQGVVMPEAAARALQIIESETDEAHGVLLYALAAALRPRSVLVVGDRQGAVTLWLALAVRETGKLTALDEEGAPLPEQRAWLPEAELSGVLADELGPEDRLFEMVVLAGASGASLSVWEWVRGSLAPEAAVVAEDSEVVRAAFPREVGWRTVRLETAPALLLAARTERPPRYTEGPREVFVAALVGLMKPGTLALGSNVIFDGTVKPRSTKVNFSGSGGQIGAGDLLIAHPDALNWYAPLPGAVALVFGPLDSSIQSFNVGIPLEDGSVTLVVA